MEKFYKYFNELILLPTIEQLIKNYNENVKNVIINIINTQICTEQKIYMKFKKMFNILPMQKELTFNIADILKEKINEIKQYNKKKDMIQLLFTKNEYNNIIEYVNYIFKTQKYSNDNNNGNDNGGDNGNDNWYENSTLAKSFFSPIKIFNCKRDLNNCNGCKHYEDDFSYLQIGFMKNDPWCLHFEAKKCNFSHVNFYGKICNKGSNYDGSNFTCADLTGIMYNTNYVSMDDCNFTNAFIITEEGNKLMGFDLIEFLIKEKGINITKFQYSEPQDGYHGKYDYIEMANLLDKTIWSNINKK